MQLFYERGNEAEKNELEAFYENDKIKTALCNIRKKIYTIYKNKKKHYFYYNTVNDLLKISTTTLMFME
ncbi:hypothetical protein [Flavobacterium sp.]|uniref:hypothetical protein n=1 Tax=Flavobacterium sp. TaxID=239 RepID=UPI003F69B7AE